MPRRYFPNELSDSAAIRRLLDAGITTTTDILNVCHWFRCGAWEPLLRFFAERHTPWPSMFPIGANPSPSLVRVARSRWRRGVTKPRRRAGLPPIRRRKKAGRKFISKSDRIRLLLARGATTEQIRQKLGCTANLVRQVRHAG